MRLPILSMVVAAVVVATLPTVTFAQASGAAARKQAATRRDPPRLTSQRKRVASKPLTAIDGVLEKPLEKPLDFQKMLGRDVIRQLQDVAGVNLLVHQRELAEQVSNGFLNSPVTVRVPAGLPLHAALDRVLGWRNCWFVRDGLIEIILDPLHSDMRRPGLFVHVHDVSDLAAEAGGVALLGQLVERLVASGNRGSFGGLGRVRPDGTKLVVSQFWSQQREIAGLLDVLRRLKATPVDARRPFGDRGYWSDRPAVVAARAALDKSVDVAFEKTPLREVMARLATQVGVPISVDGRPERRPTSIDLDGPVTFEAKGGRLAVVLDRILKPMRGLQVEVWDDGLVVTDDEVTSLAVYPVGHLAGGDRSVGSLVVLLADQVSPPSWAPNGGQGLIFPIDADVPCLVIRQSTAGHRAVHEFLESLGPSGQPGDLAPTREPDPKPGSQKVAPS